MSPHQPTPPARDLSFTDQHIIETPEQVHLQFAVAGIGSRFLAVAIDTLIQIAAGLVLALVLGIFGFIGLLQRWQITSLWLVAALIALAFLLAFGYFAFFEILWSGQTPGKRAIGIRVIKENGRPLSAAETIGRNLMRIVDQMPGFYAVAVVTAMFNAQSKRLGDFVAGSIVVYEKSLGSVQRSLDVTPPPVLQSLLGANRLTPDEIALIDTFFVRRSELAPDVRHRMAQEILRRLEPKLTLTDDHRIRVETTLESIADEHRSATRY